MQKESNSFSLTQLLVPLALLTVFVLFALNSIGDINKNWDLKKYRFYNDTVFAIDTESKINKGSITNDLCRDLGVPLPVTNKSLMQKLKDGINKYVLRKPAAHASKACKFNLQSQTKLQQSDVDSIVRKTLISIESRNKKLIKIYETRLKALESRWTALSEMIINNHKTAAQKKAGKSFLTKVKIFFGAEDKDLENTTRLEKALKNKYSKDKIVSCLAFNAFTAYTEKQVNAITGINDTNKKVAQLVTLSRLVDGKTLPNYDKPVFDCDFDQPKLAGTLLIAPTENNAYNSIQKLLVANQYIVQAKQVIALYESPAFWFVVLLVTSLLSIFIVNSGMATAGKLVLLATSWLAATYVTGFVFFQLNLLIVIVVSCLIIMYLIPILKFMWLKITQILAFLPFDFLKSWADKAMILSNKKQPQLPELKVNWLLWMLFFILTTIGALLLFDQGLNFAIKNRYIFLHNISHIYIASAVFFFIMAVRKQLFLIFDGVLSFIVDTPHNKWIYIFIIFVVFALFVVMMVVPLLGKPTLTASIAKLYMVIVGAYFVMRFTVESSIYGIGRKTKIFRFLVFAIIISPALLILAVSKDYGQLLVTLGTLSFAIAIAALINNVKWPLFVLLFLAAVLMFFILKTDFDVSGTVLHIGERIDSIRNPFLSHNEHVARLLWFQSEAKDIGFKLGSTPWCGYIASKECLLTGLPLQLQSDYTYTALIGVLSWKAPIAFGVILLFLILYLMSLTTAENKFNNAKAAQIYNYFIWIAVFTILLIILQSAITVLGNVAKFPLTGITLPMVSFGLLPKLLFAILLALIMPFKNSVKGRKS